VAGLVALSLAACDSPGEPEPSPSPSTASAPQPTPSGPASRLTFALNAPRDEAAAFTAVTEIFDSLRDDVRVELAAGPAGESVVDQIRAGGEVPDLFMVEREELAFLLEEDLTLPVDTLLDERGVDFGDGYSRDALQAFSAEDRLQCMPYGISPRVIFYNTELVDFDRMEARELPVPNDGDAHEEGIQRESWGFESFTAAVEFATRPRLGTRGYHIDPELRSLAPTLYSGGGQLFDDDVDPTSLAFSDGDSQEALERALPLYRNPLVTLTPQQLEQRSPLAWFKSGKLAMIQGDRSLVPELRQVQSLDFDVIAMPVLDGSATVGDITGLCLSADSDDVPAAADLMVHVLSTPSVQRVVRAGYLVPANLEVALSDDFLQPGRLPRTAQVFNNAIRAIQVPPLITTWDDLEAAVSDDLDLMLNQPVLDDLDALTEQIDEDSRSVLDPEAASPSSE
jgi:multiple sugar transport system substrate-binding protein